MSDDKNDKDSRNDNRNDNRGGGRRNDQGNFSKRRVYMRRKVCRFCADKTLVLDYKQVDLLRRFTTEGGKIIPRRISGNCSKHQRQLAKAIKVARSIALLPYVKQ